MIDVISRTERRLWYRKRERTCLDKHAKRGKGTQWTASDGGTVAEQGPGLAVTQMSDDHT